MTTFIERAIGEAVEKGWNDTRDLDSQVTVAFCDPTFWQSLGKARGWTTKFEVMTGISEEGVEHSLSGGEMDKWQYEWHRFIDHLAEKKDPELFFAALYTEV